jgi:ssDNA-binding Zn-finger/Zn-ribbon topoisomerase 1
VAEGRAGGFLIERAGAHGKFFVCATGKEACGFITDKPKNAKQRKAMQETRCPVCQGAMRLRLPKEKARKVALACCQYPHCQGMRWFNGKGTLEEVRTQSETGPPCPECGTPTVKRGPASTGHYFWSCARWRSDGSGCHAKPIWITAMRV